MPSFSMSARSSVLTVTPSLLANLLEKHRQKMNKHVVPIRQEAMERLCGYDFPGNVRELENLIEQAMILSSGSQLDPGEWLPALRVTPIAAGIPTLQAYERDLMLERIRARRGNLGLAAKDLGISRTTHWRRMKKYEIETRGTGRTDVAD